MTPRVRPLKQPAHSALCGLYAAANAVRRVTAELDLHWDEAQEADLIEELVFRLGRDVLIENFVARGQDPGIEADTVVGLVEVSQDCLLRQFGIQSFVQKLSKLASNHSEALDQLRLQTSMPGHVAIVSLWGEPAHWSVAHRVRSGTVYLFDSADVTQIPAPFRVERSRTAAKRASRQGGCVLCLAETLLLGAVL